MEKYQIDIEIERRNVEKNKRSVGESIKKDNRIID